MTRKTTSYQTDALYNLTFYLYYNQPVSLFLGCQQTHLMPEIFQQYIVNSFQFYSSAQEYHVVLGDC